MKKELFLAFQDLAKINKIELTQKASFVDDKDLGKFLQPDILKHFTLKDLINLSSTNKKLNEKMRPVIDKKRRELESYQKFFKNLGLNATIENIDQAAEINVSVPRSSNELVTVPNFNLPKLKILKINHRKFDTVPNFELPNLEKLDLSYNQLVSVPNFKQSSLPKLKDLNLGNNELTTIPNFDLPNLENFSLHGNQLVTVPDFNLPKLKELYMGYNNLTKIPNFKNMGSLEWFIISNNKLDSVPDFRYLNALENINIGFNNLTSIPKFNQPNLKLIDLGVNKLDSFPDFDTNNVSFILFENNFDEETKRELREKYQGYIMI